MFIIYGVPGKIYTILQLLTCFYLVINQQACYAEDPQAFISSLKQTSKGPFEAIKWYCSDGTILPARANGCGVGKEGFQHGKLRDDVLALRERGFVIANLFVALERNDIENLSNHPRALTPLVLERYLYFRDDGWIYRGARSYRGAIQEEDESLAANKLLLRLTSNKDWRSSHFLLLREAVKFFPRQFNPELITQIRSLATSIASSDSRFKKHKDRLHAFIDPSDASIIRQDAVGKKSNGAHERLATLIETLHSKPSAEKIIETLIPRLPLSSATREIDALYQRLKQAKSFAERYIVTGSIIHSLRSILTLNELSAQTSLEIIYANLAIEEQLIASHPRILNSLTNIKLADRLELLAATVHAVYGAGLISEREFNSAFSAIRSCTVSGTKKELQKQLRYLGLLPAWATGEFNWEFGIAIQKLKEIEPLVNSFIADRLRAGPLALYAPLLASLVSDSDLRDVTNEIFGVRDGGEIYPLSPGVARGGLKVADSEADVARAGPNDILITSETISELPRVKGIITIGGMNVLSHIQLLAMNLGIPHISVDSRIADLLRTRNGDKILFEVSPDGKVVIEEDLSLNDPGSDSGIIKKKQNLVKKKVDRSVSKLFTLSELSYTDSGRIVGPKAANLAMLKKEYPEHVAAAVVIPFGFFGKLFELPCAGQKSLQEYIVSTESVIKSLSPTRQKQELAKLLLDIRSCIQRSTFTENFVAELSAKLHETLGPSYLSQGVFIRSDTNVEDLPHFTGAGLNRTIPNVKSFNEILQGIRQVWESPFSERAVTWRGDVISSLTDLFVSVIIQQAVPVEKSGVLISADIYKSGLAPLPAFIVSTNEGVGGAVDNQWTESLLVSQRTGEVWIYSEASSATKKVLAPKGGISIEETILSERILTSQELSILSQLADDIPGRFAAILSDGKSRLPADIEFGFLKGRLLLFQIRPLRRASLLSER